MNVEEIKSFIRDNSESDIYDRFLLGQEVWYFRKHITGSDPLLFYDNFKRLLSRNLDIHFNSISIIGSAKTRFSFSPKKDFREFNAESDFDIVLVSSTLFNGFWDTYYNISKEQRIENYPRITSNVFNRFVSFRENENNYDNKFIMDWERRVSSFRTELQILYKIYQPINYRIYSDWQAVEKYHINGVKKLKERLYEIDRAD